MNKLLALFLLLPLASCTSTGEPGVELTAEVTGSAVIGYDVRRLVVAYDGTVSGQVRTSELKAPIFLLEEQGQGWRVRDRETEFEERGAIGAPLSPEAWAVATALLTLAELQRAGLVPPPVVP